MRLSQLTTLLFLLSSAAVGAIPIRGNTGMYQCHSLVAREHPPTKSSQEVVVGEWWAQDAEVRAEQEALAANAERERQERLRQLRLRRERLRRERLRRERERLRQEQESFQRSQRQLREASATLARQQAEQRERDAANGQQQETAAGGRTADDQRRLNGIAHILGTLRPHPSLLRPPPPPPPRNGN